MFLVKSCSDVECVWPSVYVRDHTWPSVFMCTPALYNPSWFILPVISKHIIGSSHLPVEVLELGYIDLQLAATQQFITVRVKLLKADIILWLFIPWSHLLLIRVCDKNLLLNTTAGAKSSSYVCLKLWKMVIKLSEFGNRIVLPLFCSVNQPKTEDTWRMSNVYTCYRAIKAPLLQNQLRFM